MQATSWIWRDRTLHLVPHGNVEEMVEVEMLEDGSVRTAFVSSEAPDRLRGMGWISVEPSLPEKARPFVVRRLAEERESPSEILRTLWTPL